MQPQKQIRIEDICAILEMSPTSYGLRGDMQKEEAVVALQEFKDLVKKQHRVLVKKYHPDLPSSGDVEEERMKEINNIIDMVMKLAITTHRRQVPGPAFHRFNGRQKFGSWSNNSTTDGSYTGTFHFRY